MDQTRWIDAPGLRALSYPSAKRSKPLIRSSESRYRARRRCFVARAHGYSTPRAFGVCREGTLQVTRVLSRFSACPEGGPVRKGSEFHDLSGGSGLIVIRSKPEIPVGDQ